MTKHIKKLTFLAVALAFLVVGCSKDDVGPNGNDTAEKGTFTVAMTDSPADYEALDVEILKIEAYLQGEGWVTLENEAATYSVLELNNGVQTTIASQTKAETKTGVYTMLKLTFGSNNRLQLNEAATLELGPLYVHTNGLLDLRFEGEKEVIIEVDEEVSSKTGASVLLDFNVASSIKKDVQDYVIDPVIAEIKNTQTGVRGQVQGAASAMVEVSNESGTFSTYINAEGEFLLRGMDEGTYTLTCIPSRTDSIIPQNYELEGLVVTKGEIETVGTINF
jgi:hypothetical protein